MNTLQDKADALLAQPLSQGPTVAELRERVRRRRRHRALAVAISCCCLIGVGSFIVASRPTERDVSVASGPNDPTTSVTYPPGYTPLTIWDDAALPTPLIEEPLRSDIVKDSHQLADCMTQHGYPYMQALPDSYGDGHTDGGTLQVVPQFETQFQTATAACQSELHALQADNLASHPPFAPDADAHPSAYDSVDVVDDNHLNIKVTVAQCEVTDGAVVTYEAERIIVTVYSHATEPCGPGMPQQVIPVRLNEPLAGRPISDGSPRPPTPYAPPGSS